MDIFRVCLQMHPIDKIGLNIWLERLETTFLPIQGDILLYEARI